MIDDLRLLEKWGWLEDAEIWLDTRLLRNRLIHEYRTDPIVFADALDTAHARVRLLVARGVCWSRSSGNATIPFEA